MKCTSPDGAGSSSKNQVEGILSDHSGAAKSLLLLSPGTASRSLYTQRPWKMAQPSNLGKKKNDILLQGLLLPRADFQGESPPG